VKQMQHDYLGGSVAHRDYGPLLGVPFKIILANGVEEYVDKSSGKVVTEIRDVAGLIAAIVQSRALHPRKLSGDDLKFIRSALCLKSHEVASALDLSPEHYSRCETGSKTLSSEKFYRMYVFLGAIFKDRGLKERLSKERLFEESVKSSSPERAKKAMAAFSKIFLEMKLDCVYLAGEPLELTFFRRVRADDGLPRGDQDGDWLSEIEPEAA
jgi:transcriptional regulator with XRE-family HTH domain